MSCYQPNYVQEYRKLFYQSQVICSRYAVYIDNTILPAFIRRFINTCKGIVTSHSNLVWNKLRTYLKRWYQKEPKLFMLVTFDKFRIVLQELKCCILMNDYN